MFDRDILQEIKNKDKEYNRNKDDLKELSDILMEKIKINFEPYLHTNINMKYTSDNSSIVISFNVEQGDIDLTNFLNFMIKLGHSSSSGFGIYLPKQTSVHRSIRFRIY
jgi:hypothetical protein